MKEIVLVFPHQLFEENTIIEKLQKSNASFEVFIIEDYLYFRQYAFHKQKLVFHRASMKCYERYLSQKYKNISLRYLESSQLPSRSSFWDYLSEVLTKQQHDAIRKTHVYETVDCYLEKDVKKFCTEHNIELNVERTPLFINSSEDNQFFFETKNRGKKPFMKTFYEWQRQRLQILMEEDTTRLKPRGGKYSFDAENRKKLPSDYREKITTLFEKNIFTAEAFDYVEKNFSNNYGHVDTFNYAIDFSDAKEALLHFLETKLDNFGIYEDSISEKFDYINHSILTPYLNTGLLTPEYVVRETLQYYEKNSEKIALSSVEGFIRQIIGWREFIRAMYILHGSKMRTTNFWNHTKPVPHTFWSADTGNRVIDTTIQRTLKNAYNHHIERLMILGNYMLLSEYHPDHVYKWFMEMYIDSYDWVMVPNVYSMSQFADGGIFATKPYICASNYILKMSDYTRDKHTTGWDKDFDDKFWSFLKKNKDYLSKNIRFKMLLTRIP
ncbi:cryptochrome/photolyase family protein [bacterium]|nr:cryptochrome/photolyase family protein [bacterium]